MRRVYGALRRSENPNVSTASVPYAKEESQGLLTPTALVCFSRLPNPSLSFAARETSGVIGILDLPGCPEWVKGLPCFCRHRPPPGVILIFPPLRRRSASESFAEKTSCVPHLLWRSSLREVLSYRSSLVRRRYFPFGILGPSDKLPLPLDHLHLLHRGQPST